MATTSTVQRDRDTERFQKLGTSKIIAGIIIVKIENYKPGLKYTNIFVCKNQNAITGNCQFLVPVVYFRQ